MGTKVITTVQRAGGYKDVVVFLNAVKNPKTLCFVRDDIQ